MSWPTVIPSAVADYVPAVEPKTSVVRGYCSPESIDQILKVGNSPAIRSILDRLRPWEGPPPRLSGELPTFTTQKPTEPIPPTEPKISNFAPAEGERSLLRKLGHKLLGDDCLTPDERRAYDAAVYKYQSELRAYEKAMQSYEKAVAESADSRAAYEERVGRLKESLVEATRRYQADIERRDAAVAADASEIERLFESATDGDSEAICTLARYVWQSVPLPADFPRECSVEFDQESGTLLYLIEVPDFERVPLTTALKTSRKAVGERGKRIAQQKVNHVLPLRLAHEVFATAELGLVRLVGINVRLAFIDRRDGRHRADLVASMMATRDEFEAIDISEVDPKLCFRSLRGVETPSYEQISPVRPLLNFDRDDRRIVQARAIVDRLSAATNLAAMDWEDFEHIVRELFAKMFSARSVGAEVHVTRASRDYGVDALVFDPDPIMGGKYVIQAKRYVNTVDVAAVRDLFGTVQNEGAGKGFLVTTSSFGPDAHQFAKGKPLTLIDGHHLLSLLTDHGYQFRIDLNEARRVLKESQGKGQPSM